MKVLLKGGRVMNPAADFDETADVLIENGKVAKIAKTKTFNVCFIISKINKICSFWRKDNNIRNTHNEFFVVFYTK